MATVTWEARQEANYSEEMLQARGFRRAYASFDFDASYPTGGEAITPPMTNVIQVNISGQGGYLLEWDYTNDKLLAKYFDYDAVADGAAIEVAAATDLSAVTGVKLEFIGYD